MNMRIFGWWESQPPAGVDLAITKGIDLQIECVEETVKYCAQDLLAQHGIGPIKHHTMCFLCRVG